MKKKLPTIDEWRKATGRLVDHHIIPRKPEWKEDFLAKRKQPIIHKNCGKSAGSKSKTAFCASCGASIFLHLESRGFRHAPRMFYVSVARGAYCPRCLKITSFAFLQYTRVEKMKWSAWKCACGTIHIIPEDPEVSGEINLVGDTFKDIQLDPWREKKS